MSIIGIDYTAAVFQGGGIGRYTRELMQAVLTQPSSHEYRLIVTGKVPSSVVAPPYSNGLHSTFLSNKWLSRLWYKANIHFPFEYLIGKVDLYHATDFVLPPLKPSAKSIVTVHDLTFIRSPETATPQLKAYLNKVVPYSVRRADRILADSTATKNDLIDIYQLPEEKITVLLSGVNEQFVRVHDVSMVQAVRIKYKIGTRPYILAVGTVQPRKNYVRLVKALKQIHSLGYSDVCLVIAGGRGWLNQELLETLEVERMTNHVILTGFVVDEDLPALYSGAVCSAFISLYEGFGLPVLESMACETPVVASNISSIPEVAGTAAPLVNPYNIDEIVHVLAKMIDDTKFRNELTQKGLQQVKKFSWQDSAYQLTRLYESTLNL